MSKVCRFSIFAFGMVVGLHTIADKLFGSVYIATMSANGLSDVNIGLAMSFASAALTIFDYPSGNIADIFGRKKTMGYGFIIWGAGILAFAQSSVFVHYLLSFLPWTLGMALISGTPQSWLVDRLESEGAPNLRKSVMPLALGVGIILGSLAASASGLLVKTGIASPITVSGWLGIASGIGIIILLPENYGRRDIKLVQAVKLNTSYIIRNPVMRLLMTKSALGRISLQVFVVSWQLYAIKQLGLTMAALGPILTIFILTLAVGNAASAWLMKRIHPVRVSALGHLIIVLGTLVIVFFPTLPVFLVGAILFELGLGIDSGAASSWVHDYFPSSQRSSLLSALSTAGSTMGIITPTLVGLVIQSWSFAASWFIAVISSLMTIAVLYKLGKHGDGSAASLPD